MTQYVVEIMRTNDDYDPEFASTYGPFATREWAAELAAGWASLINGDLDVEDADHVTCIVMPLNPASAAIHHWMRASV